MNKSFVKTIAVFLSALALMLFIFRGDVRNIIDEWQKSGLPPEVSYSPRPSATPEITTASKSPLPVKSTPVIVNEINLAVPFSAQAPTGDWSLPFQEACEETSALLVHRFYTGQDLTSFDAIGEIHRLVEWQNSNLGFYKHTTSAETALILKGIYAYKKVEVKYGITIEDIKTELRAGRPVIVPLAGRLLGNPYYTSPGPVYHMLVVKGFTREGQIITNDVGTRRGQNYVYDPDVFYNAIHDVPSGGDDWPAGVDPAEYILTGRKAMIVVYPN